MPSESLIIHPMRRNSGTKICQNPKIKDIELPYSKPKLSQFPGSTTFICKDTPSLDESMSLLGKFDDISGLKLNSKTKKISVDRLIGKQ